MSSFSRKPKGDNTYYHHDDRGPNNFTPRHVSFKAGPSGKGKMTRQRGWDQKIRKYMEQDDVDMNVNIKRNNNGRFNPMKGRGGGMRKFFDRRLPESPSSWYKITLGHCRKYNRNEVMKELQAFLQPVPFVPIAFKLEDDDMTFFVDNHKTAHTLQTANCRLQMRDGWKMQIRVSGHMPFVELNPELKEKIRQAMSAKYDTRTQHLDLSKFYSNEDFMKNDVFVPLNRPNMLLAAFQIIIESVPNLRSISLSDNKIFSTEHFSMLKRLVDLKAIDLSKNKIGELNKLDPLHGMKIETLVLDENPLCDKFQDQTTYVREVRKIFRSLLNLDGVELPPPVSFDIEEAQHRLPQSQGNFLCNADGREFTRHFLEQYYAMYDNQHSRDAISEAYAENAQFSMSAFTSQSVVSLNKYLSESRNLKKVNNFERRTKLLHVGKQEIVRFLNVLPKTQHDLPSFTVDLTVFKPDYVISLCVNGVFRETENMDHKSYVKAFSRTFILISAGRGSGFNIINDMLSITTASEGQLSMAFQPQPSTSIDVKPPMLNTGPCLVEGISPAFQTQPSTSVDVKPPLINSTPISPIVSQEETELNRKREMVTTLAMQTGMNLIWSEKCLVETNWDFNNALYAFTEFNKIGKIPPEAFSK